MTTSTTTAFAMPSLGADMDEGRIVEWLVAPGDHVERGQIVVIVQTEKSDIEVEVFESATVDEILVGEGELVPVGTPIARMVPDHPSAAPVEEPEPEPAAAEPAASSAPAAPAAAAGGPGVESEAGHVTSPVLRHLAEELHVDATHLHGSGPGGRIVRADVERAARPAGRRITPRARRLMVERNLAPERFADRSLVTGADVLAAPAAAPSIEPSTSEAAPEQRAATERTRQESMRRHIAELMSRSWREIPHYHLAQRLDLSVALEHLGAANEQRPLAERIVPGALLLCAAARAARKVPQCNGWWHGGRFEGSDTVDLGLVLSLRSGGVIVPTIQRADELSPAEMMERMTELVQRARQGRLRSSHLGEASITVTSLGERGADEVIGVIHPPQVALVGFGAVRNEVWPEADGTGIVVRPTVHATLAGDHRATDGVVGSRLLTQMQSLLDGALPDELDALAGGT